MKKKKKNEFTTGKWSATLFMKRQKRTKTSCHALVFLFSVNIDIRVCVCVYTLKHKEEVRKKKKAQHSMEKASYPLSRSTNKRKVQQWKRNKDIVCFLDRSFPA